MKTVLSKQCFGQTAGIRPTDLKSYRPFDEITRIELKIQNAIALNALGIF